MKPNEKTYIYNEFSKYFDNFEIIDDDENNSHENEISCEIEIALGSNNTTITVVRDSRGWLIGLDEISPIEKYPYSEWCTTLPDAIESLIKEMEETYYPIIFSIVNAYHKSNQ